MSLVVFIIEPTVFSGKIACILASSTAPHSQNTPQIFQTFLLCLLKEAKNVSFLSPDSKNKIQPERLEEAERQEEAHSEYDK